MSSSHHAHSSQSIGGPLSQDTSTHESGPADRVGNRQNTNRNDPSSSSNAHNSGYPPIQVTEVSKRSDSTDSSDTESRENRFRTDAKKLLSKTTTLIQKISNLRAKEGNEPEQNQKRNTRRSKRQVTLAFAQ